MDSKAASSSASEGPSTAEQDQARSSDPVAEEETEETADQSISLILEDPEDSSPLELEEVSEEKMDAGESSSKPEASSEEKEAADATLGSAAKGAEKGTKLASALDTAKSEERSRAPDRDVCPEPKAPPASGVEERAAEQMEPEAALLDAVDSAPSAASLDEKMEPEGTSPDTADIDTPPSESFGGRAEPEGTSPDTADIDTPPSESFGGRVEPEGTSPDTADTLSSLPFDDKVEPEGTSPDTADTLSSERSEEKMEFEGTSPDYDSDEANLKKGSRYSSEATSSYSASEQQTTTGTSSSRGSAEQIEGVRFVDMTTIFTLKERPPTSPSGEIQVKNLTFFWSVPDFPNAYEWMLRGDWRVESPVTAMTLGDTRYRWVVTMFPEDSSISIYLNSVSQFMVLAACNFSIIDKNNVVVLKKGLAKYSYVNNANKNGVHRLKDFCRKSYIMENASTLLPNNELKIMVEVTLE